MNENIVEFLDRSRIQEEAGAWLIRLDSEEPPSAQELDALHEWCSRSPMHCGELQSLALFWDKMNILTELAVPLGKPNASHEQGSSAHGQGLLRSIRWAGTMAAIALVGVIATGYWVVQDPLTATNGRHTTSIGQQQTTTLADGSVIQLNTDTQLRVDYEKKFRNIRLLQGEAYFTVAKDSARPFRVYAGSGRVQALGTAFSVYLKGSDINVAVTEGRVALSALEPLANRAPIEKTRSGDRRSGSDTGQILNRNLSTLDAGQGVTINVGSGGEPGGKAGGEDNAGISQLVVRHWDQQQLQRQLSWRNGLLIFAGDSLQQVINEISRYTTLTIEITDPELKSIKIGGQFRIGDIDAMLDSLEVNFGVRVVRLDGGRIQLASAN